MILKFLNRIKQKMTINITLLIIIFPLFKIKIYNTNQKLKKNKYNLKINFRKKKI